MLLAAALAGCGGATSAPSPTVTGLTIAGTASLPGVGQTSQLSVVATMSSGGSQTVTNQATWQSSNSAVAIVSTSGLVTAQGYGVATIGASYQGMTAQYAFVVTIAGTWVASANGASIQWILAQSQGIVTGTFSVGPLTPGNSLSTSTVGGTVNGSTFTWTMTGTVGSDSGRPECVGVTLIIQGVAQVQTGGTVMSAVVQSANGVCDPSLTPSVSPGTAIAFTRQ